MQKKELLLKFTKSYVEMYLEIKPVLFPILKSFSGWMGIKCLTISILDNKNKFFIDCIYGHSARQELTNIFELEEQIKREVMKTGNIVVLPNLTKKNYYYELIKETAKFADKNSSFIYVPIKFNKNIFGILSMYRIYKKNYSFEKDLAFLKILSNLLTKSLNQQKLTMEMIGDLNEELNQKNNEYKIVHNFSHVYGNSEIMNQTYSLIENILNNNVPILIYGEPGVGKKELAQLIHSKSNRSNKPFITVNCNEISEYLTDYELFGYEEKSFTGVLKQQKSKFEMANPGTIFINKIDKLSKMSQYKLLNFIDNKNISRNGSYKVIPIDVRIICATSYQPEILVETGIIRKDLYYKINVFPLYIPPLRQRSEDIITLTNHFIEKYSKINNKKIKKISEKTMNMLIHYHWKGNIKELECYIEQAVQLSDENLINENHFPPLIQFSNNNINEF